MNREPTPSPIAYRIDGLVIVMFILAISDVVTTYYGLKRLPVREMNPVLGPLLKHSFVWLPVYCFVRPCLVPLIPLEIRRPIVLFYSLAHLYGGLSNSALLFFGFSFVTIFGYWVPLGIMSLGILGMFFYDFIRFPRNRWIMVSWVAGTVVIFFGIEFVFYLLGARVSG